MSAQLNGGVAKKRTGSSADILGLYAYGDAYYVSHVLRYYSADGSDGVSVKGGEAAKVKYEDKQNSYGKVLQFQKSVGGIQISCTNNSQNI